MEEKYKYLGHTSEAKFQAFGRRLENVFENSVLAMTNLMVDVERVFKLKKREIELESSSLKALLYDLLDEILLIKDAEGMFISDFEDLQIKERRGTYHLKATAVGDDILNYETKADVKSPTYHDMDLRKIDHEWMSQVVVDV